MGGGLFQQDAAAHQIVEGGKEGVIVLDGQTADMAHAEQRVGQLTAVGADDDAVLVLQYLKEVVGGDLRVIIWAGFRVVFAGVGRECDGRL